MAFIAVDPCVGFFFKPFLFCLAKGIFVNGSLAEAEVTLCALAVQCRRMRRYFGVLHIGFIMAIQTRLRNFALFRLRKMAFAAGHEHVFFTGGMVVAIETVQAISRLTGMGLVIKKNFAGIGLVHDADGGLRFFYRERGITDDGHQ